MTYLILAIYAIPSIIILLLCVCIPKNRRTPYLDDMPLGLALFAILLWPLFVGIIYPLIYDFLDKKWEAMQNRKLHGDYRRRNE